MRTRAKTVIITVFVFLLAVCGLLLRHVKPLIPSATKVLYAETEDFRSDGTAYAPAFRRNVLYLHLPAARPEHQWWVVNYNTMMVYSPRTPVSLLLVRFVFRKDFFGVPLSDRTRLEEWNWQFTGKNASFAGNGLTCIVRRPGR